MSTQVQEPQVQEREGWIDDPWYGLTQPPLAGDPDGDAVHGEPHIWRGLD